MSVKFFIIPSYIRDVSQIPRWRPSVSLNSLLTANKSRLRCMMQEDILCKILCKSFRRKARWKWSWYDGMDKRCCYTVSGMRGTRYSRIGSSWEKPKVEWAGDGAQHLVLFWNWWAQTNTLGSEAATQGICLFLFKFLLRWYALPVLYSRLSWDTAAEKLIMPPVNI